MKDEIQAAVSEAVVPLKAEIEALKAQVAALAQIAQMAKPVELPPMVQEARAIFSSLPMETVKALGVVQVGFDPKMVWFRMRRQNGTTISVKKLEAEFRVRLRDKTGRLLKTLKPSFNGLNGALKSLV